MEIKRYKCEKCGAINSHKDSYNDQYCYGCIDIGTGKLKEDAVPEKKCTVCVSTNGNCSCRGACRCHDAVPSQEKVEKATHYVLEKYAKTFKDLAEFDSEAREVPNTKPSQVEKKKCSKAAFYDPQCKACNEANEVEDTQPEWEKDFARKFTIAGKIKGGTIKGVYQTFVRWATKPDPDTIISFIRSTLLTQREELEKEIEGMKRFISYNPRKIKKSDTDYNKAIRNVLEVLKGKK